MPPSMFSGRKWRFIFLTFVEHLWSIYGAFVEQKYVSHFKLTLKTWRTWPTGSKNVKKLKYGYPEVYCNDFPTLKHGKSCIFGTFNFWSHLWSIYGAFVEQNCVTDLKLAWKTWWTLPTRSESVRKWYMGTLRCFVMILGPWNRALLVF